MSLTSIGYDTTTTKRLTEVDWAKALPRVGGAFYGVDGADDWRVTAVAGLDRTVAINIGAGFGHGVHDTLATATNNTLQMDIVSSGSRWDLVATRRAWQNTGGGPTVFAKINGSATKEIPSGRLKNPGVQDDQPLALVQTTAGQSQPTALIDLRCWASNGGLVAVDLLALDYLAAPGADVRIGADRWLYLPDANRVFGWRRVNEEIVEKGKFNVTTTTSAPYQPRTINLPAGKFTASPNIDLTWESPSGLPPRMRLYSVGASSFGVNVMSDVGEVSGTVHWTARQ